jgi:hypothetical protein
LSVGTQDLSKSTVRHGLKTAPPRITHVFSLPGTGVREKCAKRARFACRLWFHERFAFPRARLRAYLYSTVATAWR